MAPKKTNIDIDSVVKQIEELIFTGEIQPRERLIIEDLANRLNTSTYKIRNALKALEEKGLLMNIPHKGAVVASLSEEEVEEIFVVRVGLERIVSRLACANATEKDLIILEEINSRIKRYSKENQHSMMIKANQEFHNYLIGLSGNKVLTQMLLKLKVRFHILNTTAWSSSESIKLLLTEHDEYLVALRTGNVELLDDLSERHLKHAKDLFLKNLRTKRAIIV